MKIITDLEFFRRICFSFFDDLDVRLIELPVIRRCHKMTVTLILETIKQLFLREGCHKSDNPSDASHETK